MFIGNVPFDASQAVLGAHTFGGPSFCLAGLRGSAGCQENEASNPCEGSVKAVFKGFEDICRHPWTAFVVLSLMTNATCPWMIRHTIKSGRVK